MTDFFTADILLPKNIKSNWACIACDQFTSDKKYWENVKEAVGEDRSTYNMILPEIFLEGNDLQQRINGINSTMNSYLHDGVFDEYRNSMIFVRRMQSNGLCLEGIVGTISLDDYDYRPGAKSCTRATEQTVIERIPPRVNIRKDAPLELPHILLLIDDSEKTVIEKVNTKESEKLYDIPLMLGGGSVQGYRLSKAQEKAVQHALELLKNKNDGFLFAVGDGNHSLATAKECAALSGDELSKKALVEIVNIHSEAIQFEPIYRVLFGCDPQKVIDDFVSSLGGEYYGDNAQRFTAHFGGEEREISVKPSAKLPVGTLQGFLDKYLKENTEVSIDYIHGESDAINLSKQEKTLCFIFDGMKKNELFPAISTDGSLPRKTFSMGHAQDKRYYIEARRIKSIN